MNKFPKIIAHRGYSGKYPENTMLAFEKALSEGQCHGIETDIQLTGDDQIVVLHDSTIDRTTNGMGLVRNLTLEQLQRFDAGKRYDEKFAGERIPSLVELLDYAKNTNLLLNLELKCHSGFVPELLAQKTINLIREYGMEDRILFSSFHFGVIRYCAAQAPEIETAILYAAPFERATIFCEQHGIGGVNPAFRYIKYNPIYVGYCRGQGIKVNAWTVNRPADMQRMIQRRVDSIITDYPATLAHLMMQNALVARSDSLVTY